MFARLVMLTLEPGNLPATVKMAEEHAPILRRLPGFRSLTFLHNDERCEYGSFSVWDTREDAEAVSGVAELQVREAFMKVMKGRPSVRIFEVYDSQS
jgi:heme-degrading monooxygenase HmoA